MFVFGHTGIGSAVLRPWTEPRGRFPLWAVLLGTMLPDLIDKPLYYGLVLVTGKRGFELGLISGTRTFGHTAIFFLALTVIALLRKSPRWAAVAVGVATHLFFDHPPRVFDDLPGPPDVSALIFPLYGFRFPVMPFRDASEHLKSVGKFYLLGGELIGAFLLAWNLGLINRFKKKFFRP